MEWKRNLPFCLFHVGAVVTAPAFDISGIIPSELWLFLWGGLWVATIWAYSKEIKSLFSKIRKFRRGREVARLYLGDPQASTDPEEIARWRKEAKKRKKRDD